MQPTTYSCMSTAKNLWGRCYRMGLDREPQISKIYAFIIFFICVVPCLHQAVVLWFHEVVQEEGMVPELAPAHVALGPHQRRPHRAVACQPPPGRREEYCQHVHGIYPGNVNASLFSQEPLGILSKNNCSYIPYLKIRFVINLGSIQ